MKKFTLILALALSMLAVFSFSVFADSVCNHENATKVVTEPSCAVIGFTTVSCDCGYSIITEKQDKAPHNMAFVKSEINDETGVLTRYYSCKWCNEENEEKISLVNKCYIEGYGDELYDASSVSYFSVTADGVLSPSNEIKSLKNLNIYFPSFVKQDNEIIKIVQIKGFNGSRTGVNNVNLLSGVYVPDTVTELEGGSNIGVFGNQGTLKNIVIGKGVTSLGQEIFSGSNGGFSTFYFSSTIESMGLYCFNEIRIDDGAVYKLNLSLDTMYQIRLGKNNNSLRRVYFNENIVFNGEKMLNDIVGMELVYLPTNLTKDNPFVLPNEFMSADFSGTIVLKGYFAAGGQAVLPYTNHTIYMDSMDAVLDFIASVSSKGYSDRLTSYSTFVICTGKDAGTYKVKTRSSKIEEIVLERIGDAVHFTDDRAVAKCNENVSTYCLSCGEKTGELEKLQHELNGGSYDEAYCYSQGEINYACNCCDYTESVSVAIDPSNHDYSVLVNIEYENGFDKNGTKSFKCASGVCEDVFSEENPTAGYLILLKGISTKCDDSAICVSFDINSDAISQYRLLGNEFTYGVCGAVKNNLIGTTEPIRVENGKLVPSEVSMGGVIMAEFTLEDCIAADFRICGITEEYRDLELIMVAYAFNGENVEFIGSVDDNGKPLSISYSTVQ